MLCQDTGMNEQMEGGKENRMQEVCVLVNVCPLFCGIAGRCCGR